MALAPLLLAFLMVSALPGPIGRQQGGSPSSSATESRSGDATDRTVPASDVWIELTPLYTEDKARLFRLVAGTRSLIQEDLRPGSWMLCSGGDATAVACSPRHIELPFALEPAITEGATVSGVVLLDAAPAGGLPVSVIPANLASRRRFSIPLRLDGQEKDLIRAVETDRLGRFALPALSAGDYRLEIITPGGRIHHTEVFSVPKPSIVLRPQRKRAHTRMDLGEVHLPSGVRVTVAVVDAQGGPVQGANVGAVQGRSLEELTLFKATTEREGSAVLSELDPLEPVTISCHASGYSRTEERFEAPPPHVECSLNRLGVVRGLVVDPDDHPVPEATVALSDGGGSASTDAHGEFRIRDIPAGAYEVTVAAPGYRAQSLQLQLDHGEEQTPEPVVLMPGETFFGAVVDKVSREGIQGAVVRITQPAGGGATRTEDDGSFRLATGLPLARRGQGGLQLEVSAARYATSSVTLDEEELDGSSLEQPAVVELGLGGRIRAEAWDVSADRACSGCVVTMMKSGGPLFDVRTDQAGVAVSEPIESGRYQVTLNRERSRGSIVLVQGGDDTKWADVRSGEVTTVRFGEPALELDIRLRPATSQEWLLLAVGSSTSRVAERLDGERFVLRRETVEAVRLKLAGAQSWVWLQEIPHGFDGESLELDLPQSLVSGFLVDSEQPEAGVMLQIVSLHDSSATARTGAGGDFSVPFLGPGTYGLMVGGQLLRTFAVDAASIRELGAVDVRR